MDENQTTAISAAILPELKKAVNFWMDKTYDENSFYSHIIAIIRDNVVEQINAAANHQEQLERMIFKVQQLQQKQQMVFNGHKSYIPECKKLETELRNKCNYLISHGGYNVDRFLKQQPEQNKLF
jgi:hypothetical protein